MNKLRNAVADALILAAEAHNADDRNTERTVSIVRSDLIVATASAIDAAVEALTSNPSHDVPTPVQRLRKLVSLMIESRGANALRIAAMADEELLPQLLNHPDIAC